MFKSNRSVSIVLTLCLLLSLIPHPAGAAQATGSQIFTGSYNSAVIDGNGDLYLCGRNDTGAVGNGGVSDAADATYGYEVQTTFVKVLSNVKSFYDNALSMAAITENDDLYLWGDNDRGSLGSGSGPHLLAPAKIMENVASFSSSFKVNLAVTKNGDLYTWGVNFWEFLGEDAGDVQTTPLKVMENVSCAQLSPLGISITALTKDGSLYTWGVIAIGKVGVGIPEGAETAIVTQGDGKQSEVVVKPYKILDNIAAFRLGSYYTAALTNDGELYIWGGLGNDFGAEPKKVLTGVKSIETIDLNASAAITEKGELYHCYAKSNPKAEKIAQNAARSVSDELYLTTDGKLCHVTSRKTLLNDVASADSSGALTKTGELYLVNESKGTVEKAMGNVVWQGGCKAVTAGGELYAWGFNHWGHIGNGTTEDQETPVKVMEGLALPAGSLSLSQGKPEDTEKDGPAQPGTKPGEGSAALSALPTFGGDYATAAILENGDLYMWGRNDHGTVGNGGVSNGYATLDSGTKLAVHSTPVKVMENVASIHVASNHSAAITTNGDLYTWGINNNGQLGNGGKGDIAWHEMNDESAPLRYSQSTPVKVLENVVQVNVSGSNCTAAITQNGDLYFWGSGASTVPQKIFSGASAVFIAPYFSYKFLAVIDTSGALYLIGRDGKGAVLPFSEESGVLKGVDAEYFTQGGLEYARVSGPCKIMDNVASFHIGSKSNGIITTSGDFYESSENGAFKKVRSGVKDVCITTWSTHCLLTTGGDLYERAADPSAEWSKELSNVVSFACAYDTCAALTKNGDLYSWGGNRYGTLGGGSSGGAASPKKILSDIAAIYASEDSVTALSRDGKLYVWGSNGFGTVGNGSIEIQLSPYLALEGVALPGSTGIQITPKAQPDPNLWYYEAITFTEKNGLALGMPLGEFDPDANLTRAMLAQMLYNLEGKPAVSNSPFTDVIDGIWYTDAITWAAENNIVGGYGDGLFGPDDSITRQQMAAILYRYAAYKGYDTSARADLSGFSDSSAIQSYAVDAMRWANAEKLINGVTATTLSPAGTATCAQMATILMRFISNHT